MYSVEVSIGGVSSCTHCLRGAVFAIGYLFGHRFFLWLCHTGADVCIVQHTMNLSSTVHENSWGAVDEGFNIVCRRMGLGGFIATLPDMVSCPVAFEGDVLCMWQPVHRCPHRGTCPFLEQYRRHGCIVAGSQVWSDDILSAGKNQHLRGNTVANNSAEGPEVRKLAGW